MVAPFSRGSPYKEAITWPRMRRSGGCVLFLANQQPVFLRPNQSNAFDIALTLPKRKPRTVIFHCYIHCLQRLKETQGQSQCAWFQIREMRFDFLQSELGMSRRNSLCQVVGVYREKLLTLKLNRKQNNEVTGAVKASPALEGLASCCEQSQERHCLLFQLNGGR